MEYYPCDATLSPLGVKIAGKTFQVDNRDLIAPFRDSGYVNATTGEDFCWVAVLGG
jgi:hypothetical protein